MQLRYYMYYMVKIKNIKSEKCSRNILSSYNPPISTRSGSDRSLRVFNPSGSAMHSPSVCLFLPLSPPTVRLVCNFFFLHILLWPSWLSHSHSYLCLVACIDSTHRYARTHRTEKGEWMGGWLYDCLQFCNCY